jgi:hypothetical protein
MLSFYILTRSQKVGVREVSLRNPLLSNVLLKRISAETNTEARAEKLLDVNG